MLKDDACSPAWGEKYVRAERVRLGNSCGRSRKTQRGHRPQDVPPSCRRQTSLKLFDRLQGGRKRFVRCAVRPTPRVRLCLASGNVPLGGQTNRAQRSPPSGLPGGECGAKPEANDLVKVMQRRTLGVGRRPTTRGNHLSLIYNDKKRQ